MTTAMYSKASGHKALASGHKALASGHKALGHKAEAKNFDEMMLLMSACHEI